MENRIDLKAVDVFKLLCALMVVGIHAQPLGDRLIWGGVLSNDNISCSGSFLFCI